MLSLNLPRAAGDANLTRWLVPAAGYPRGRRQTQIKDFVVLPDCRLTVPRGHRTWR